MINILFHIAIFLAIVYTVYLSTKLIQASISVAYHAKERSKSIEHCTLTLCREAEKRMKDKVQKC